MAKDHFDSISNDIKKYTAKHNARSGFARFAKEMTCGAIFVSAVSFGIHYGIVKPLYDEQPLLDAQAQMEKGTLVVPPEFFAEYQEKCIRSKISKNDNIKLDLDGMDHDEVIELKDEYKKALDGCLDKDYQEQELTQREYVESLEMTQGFFRFGLNGVVGTTFYLLMLGYGRLSANSYEKKKKKREIDLKGFE